MRLFLSGGPVIAVQLGAGKYELDGHTIDKVGGGWNVYGNWVRQSGYSSLRAAAEVVCQLTRGWKPQLFPTAREESVSTGLGTFKLKSLNAGFWRVCGTPYIISRNSHGEWDAVHWPGALIDAHFGQGTLLPLNSPQPLRSRRALLEQLVLEGKIAPAP